MNFLIKILGKRMAQALLAMFNPNSSTFWVGPANWIATFVATHFHWINLTPEQVSLWLTTSAAPLIQQLLKKVFNGAFPSLNWGTLSPPMATMPVVPGTPVVATVAATAKVVEKASAAEPTSPAKK